MSLRECVVCGKTFDGAPSAKYCSEECKNAPRYTNEFNGERWGKLTIIDAYRKKGRVYAICKCECGNTKTVRYDALTSGRTQSCGCFAEANYYKPFDLAGKINDYGCKAIKQIRVGNRYKWECECSCGKHYLVPAGLFYKQMSCGCSHQRSARENLKKAAETCEQGYIENTSIISIKPRKMLRNNTSGVRGVSWDKNRQKWAATIVFKGKTYHLGRYNNIEDAAAVRKEAENALFGDFLKWFQEVYPERWEKFNKKAKKEETED